MSEPLRVLTSPVRVTGGLRLGHLVTLLTGDAVARHVRDTGRTVEWVAGVLAGDLASQLAVEQELVREGLDRSALTRDEFVERTRVLEADSRDRATELLTRLGIDVDLHAGSLHGDAVATAARTAFVRLYEEGLLVREERVVTTCPRCATVVDDIDVERGTAPASAITLGLGDVAVNVVAPELLAGVVAVAVPADHPSAGTTVEVPTVGRAVPVIADPDRDEPAVIVPAHDAGDLEFARRHGLAPILVLDEEGTVVEGPLVGLSRYAARSAAADLLGTDDVVGEVLDVGEAVDRCRRCGTVVVPRLGPHWFLPMPDLEVLAADAVRQGVISVAPASVSDELVAAAGQRGDWCLSHQVWAGQPVPVARCLDCGNPAVSVEGAGSCGKCMGTLVADDDVLDARFVGAVWPLAVAGWPADAEAPARTANDTVLVIAPTGLVLWAVRMAALALRLTGSPPFCRVIVHPPVDPETQLDPITDEFAVPVDRDWVAEIASGVLAG